jgi:hypothetical protein
MGLVLGGRSYRTSLTHSNPHIFSLTNGERLKEYVFGHAINGVYLKLDPDLSFFQVHPRLTWAYWCGLDLETWNRIATQAKLIRSSAQLAKLGTGRFVRNHGDAASGTKWLAVDCNVECTTTPVELLEMQLQRLRTVMQRPSTCGRELSVCNLSDFARLIKAPGQAPSSSLIKIKPGFAPG